MVECPNCGSRFLRPSRLRNFREKWQNIWFVMPVRCDHCSHRFTVDILGLAFISFARCPKCSRMDLNRWTGESYQPHGFTKLKVMLGANKFRCEYCRLNFASFRKRKEVFSFHRWERIEAARQAAKELPNADRRSGLDSRKLKRTPSDERRKQE